MQTGGLFDFASPKLSCRYRHKRTFTKSRSKSLKGVEATLWDVPKWGNHRRLLVFNTHLDPWHIENRNEQVHEIINFVGETIAAIEKEDKTYQLEDWKNTGVLVLGDFNIKANSVEYQDTLLSNLGWVDYFHDVTCQTYAIENSLACYPEDCGRIDYIFGLERYGSKYTFLPLLAVSRSIRKEPVGEESSDHYALEIELIPA
ncbi:hypothetical protein IV203_017070 [Nitzschia inconspicua]|uniref:Endonuclease/exonuclease/phosphatase domain-containing protein n=1 Tax=Nitzschia inconspicua TaxID=303405 RepID=A0A9K3KR71_9STRA|nr:hypothetical protein IV203_017070 [Nitzschia inconspicua]